MMGTASQTNLAQMQMQQNQQAAQGTAPGTTNEVGWTCECGHVNTGNSAANVGNQHQCRQESGRVSVVM